MEIWEILDRIASVMDIIVGSIALAGFITAYVNPAYFRRFTSLIRGNRHEGGEEVETLKVDGAVYTVSRKETPIWSMDKIKPSHIILIGSEQTADVEKEIREHAAQHHIHIQQSINLHDVDSVAECRDETMRAIQELRHKGCKTIAVDITGGKTTMSIGAFQAGDQENVDVIYITAPYDRNLGHPDLNRAKIYAIRESQDS